MTVDAKPVDNELGDEMVEGVRDETEAADARAAGGVVTMVEGVRDETEAADTDTVIEDGVDEVVVPLISSAVGCAENSVQKSSSSDLYMLCSYWASSKSRCRCCSSRFKLSASRYS